MAIDKPRGFDDWKHTGEKPASLETITKRLEDEIAILKDKVTQLESALPNLWKHLVRIGYMK